MTFLRTPQTSREHRYFCNSPAHSFFAGPEMHHVVTEKTEPGLGLLGLCSPCSRMAPVGKVDKEEQWGPWPWMASRPFCPTFSWWALGAAMKLSCIPGRVCPSSGLWLSPVTIPALPQDCPTARTAYRPVWPFTGSFFFTKIVAFSRLFLSTFDCTSAIANCWLENFLYINRICLMEKNYWGKCFFQPTEPNASQQQKRVKRGEKMENIKSSVTS